MRRLPLGAKDIPACSRIVLCFLALAPGAVSLEKALGRSAMVTLVTRSPDRLVPTYRRIAGR